jgi:hypothetical protein
MREFSILFLGLDFGSVDDEILVVKVGVSHGFSTKRKKEENRFLHLFLRFSLRFLRFSL